VAGDDTHGHVDDICRFVNARTVVLIKEDDPRTSTFVRWRRTGSGSRNSAWRTARSPRWCAAHAGPLYFDGGRLPASYANFYISNATVLVPTFNDPHDRVALGILGELFKDRMVVGIHAVDLVLASARCTA